MSEPTLLSLTIGTLHKELIKAREEAIIRAIDADYGYFEWRSYSDNPNIVDLYGKINNSDSSIHIARIAFTADFRGLEPLKATVRTEYKVNGIGRTNGKERKPGP